ncbi:MAG: hypothetical protein IJ733_02295 [Lachnospiraceae bacterium]|nr:hypothetical protein [Lachnospiraceae bacterium]
MSKGKFKGLYRIWVLLITVLLAGCQTGREGEEKVPSGEASETIPEGEDRVESAVPEKDLWDGFSKGAEKGDGYSFRNSTNTYTNDMEDRWGYVYQSVFGKEGEKTIQLEKNDAEIRAVSYVTDEALYYHCFYQYDPEKEKYGKGELWRVPVKKTDGYDELLFDEEKCVLKMEDLSGLYVMDSLLYVNLNSLGTVSLDTKDAADCFRIYDMEKEQWLDVEGIPDKLSEMSYCYWCGVTEEGGFLRAVKQKEEGKQENPHVQTSLYFSDRNTHELTLLKEGKYDETFFSAYDSKAFFFSNGHQVEYYQGGELREYLSEGAFDEKIKEIWNRWTEEGSGWNYRDDQWHLDEIYLSEEGSLQLIFCTTDAEKKRTDYDWMYHLQDDKSYYLQSIALACPLDSQPSDGLFELDKETKNALSTSFCVYFDRMDWEKYEASLKKEEAEVLEKLLPVLTEKKEFTLYEWDGKKKKVKDCPHTVTTIKDWIGKEKTENMLFGAVMVNTLQTGTPDLFLDLDGNDLILHPEGGEVYGLASKYFDIGQMNRLGWFSIDLRKNEGLETQYFQIQYPKEKEGEFEQAVFQMLGKEDDFTFYKNGKKIPEERMENWWGDGDTYYMATWK